MEVIVKKQISSLLKKMNEGIWEKEQIIALSLLCSVAGESIFLLGPPGTAKSLVARRLKEIFKDKISFEYLMSRFSTPDEIFGPVSISKLKNEDVYERRTEGYLPSATIVFLDEIWKAGPAIQNALLTAINEKIYQNGTETIHLPMKGLIAASNELPKEDEGLEALWDRFLVRVVSNCISNEKTFYKMLQQRQLAAVNISEDLCITNEKYETWQRQIESIEIPETILKMITLVRGGLKEISKGENVAPFDYYISDRRWKKIVHLLQASAFLNDRSCIDLSDLYLLVHTLWNQIDCIMVVWKLVVDSFFNDIDKKLDSMEKELEAMSQSLLNTEITSMESEYRIYNYFYLKVLDYPGKDCYIFMSDYKHLDFNTYTDGIIYWDDIQNAYLIRRIDTSQPFSGISSTKNLQTVKLRKCSGWIDVNGHSYLIEKGNTKTERYDIRKLECEKNLELTEIEKVLASESEKLKDRIELFKSNLFIASDDFKQVKKRADKRHKRINELEIKRSSLLESAIK